MRMMTWLQLSLRLSTGAVNRFDGSKRNELSSAAFRAGCHGCLIRSFQSDRCQ